MNAPTETGADIDSGKRATLFGAVGLAAALPAACLAPTAHALTKTLPGFKYTQFIRRAAGLSEDQFANKWRSQRGPLMKALPGLRGLAFNIVDKSRSIDAPHDAVIESWFDSPADYARTVNGDETAPTDELARSASDFMRSEMMGLFTNEHVIRPLAPGSPAPRAKRIGLVGRQPGMTQAEFFRLWIDEHAPAANDQPGLKRYLVNTLARDRLLDVPWDGYAELWWTDWQTYEDARKAIRSTVGSRLGFFHSHLLLLVEEHEDIAPPR